MLRGGHDDFHSNNLLHTVFLSLSIMHLRRFRLRRISLLSSLSFMIQMLAVSVCQMGGDAMAMGVTADHQMHHAKHMERLCVNNAQPMALSLTGVGQSAPHSSHHGPCSHCNQPDEMVSVMNVADFSSVSLPLLSMNTLILLQIQAENGDTFSPYAQSAQPPGSVPLIYRTSLRILI